MSDMKCGAPKDYKCTPYNHKTCANCRYVIYKSTRKHIIQYKENNNE